MDKEAYRIFINHCQLRLRLFKWKGWITLIQEKILKTEGLPHIMVDYVLCSKKDKTLFFSLEYHKPSPMAAIQRNTNKKDGKNNFSITEDERRIIEFKTELMPPPVLHPAISKIGYMDGEQAALIACKIKDQYFKYIHSET